MSLFGLTKTVLVKPIKEFPEAHREALRGLSFGPELGSMWRWTYHDGSTWAAVMYAGNKCSADAIMGWACLTDQEDRFPVLGVYVGKEWRCLGLAEQVLSTLLESRNLASGQALFAVSANYPRYPELLQRLGYQHLEWE